jgi:polar amino acid transport system substrate-binding protein
MIMLASLVAIALSLGGCSVVGRATTATLGEPTAEATAADAAIAAVTKSGNIQTPPTLTAGTLRVGCDLTWPPLAHLAVVQVTEGEEVKTVTQPVGFEIDLCTAVAKKMGLELEVVQSPWGDLVPALEEGQFDVIMSAILTDPVLLERLSATQPHLPGGFSITTPNGAPITGSAGLAGKTVGVQVDTPGAAVVEGVAGVKEIKRYDHIVNAFRDLVSGKLDAVVTEELISAWILKNSPDYKDKCATTGTIETESGYALWCAKEASVLLAAMDAALLELRAEGVYQKICAKWGVSGN